MGEFPPKDTQEDELRDNAINTPPLEQNLGLGARTYGDPTRANGEPMLAEKLAAVDAQKQTAENTRKTAKNTKTVAAQQAADSENIRFTREAIEKLNEEQ